MKRKLFLSFAVILLAGCTNLFMEDILQPKTASFNSNGGNSVANQTIYKGDTIKKPATPARRGYIFDAWYLDNGTFEVEWDFDIAPGENITLHANWIPMPVYGITLSPQGNKDFGAAASGYEAPEPHLVTVTNTGNQPTGELTISLSGMSSGSFLLSIDSMDSIDVDAAANFSVVPATGLTKGNYTAVVTVSGGNDLFAEFAVSFAVDLIPIPSAAVTVTAPVKGETPNTTAMEAPDNTGRFSIGAVSWSPVHNPFRGGTAYTATVTLTAGENYTFIGLTGAAINGYGATVYGNSGATVILSYTFPETEPPVVTGMEIRSQPGTLAYTHGDSLNLSGLIVRLTYDDKTIQDVTYISFSYYSIESNPAHGEPVSYTTHNGKPITLSCNGLTVSTGNLTVSRAVPFITFPAAAAITYGSALSMADFSGGSVSLGSFAWVNSAIVPPIGVSEYDVEFTPNDMVNYNYTNVFGWNGTRVVRKVEITVNKIPGAAVGTPVLSGTPSSTAITVNAVAAPGNGQTVEYAISPVNNANPASLAWQGGAAFTGPFYGPACYVYARSRENDTYSAGTPSVSAEITLSFHEITLYPSGSKDFGSASSSYAAQMPHNVEVSNTGNQPTGNLTVTLSGANSGSFALSGNTIDSIAVDSNSSFTVVPNTGLAIGNYTAIVTVSGANVYSKSFYVYFTVSAVPITDAAVTITAPETGETPNTAAADTHGTGRFTAGAVSWNPYHNPFEGDTVYTAAITLTAAGEYTFNGLSAATVNGYPASSIYNNTGTTVTLTYTFAATEINVVTGITVKTQPTKLKYTYGEKLDLSGLTVTLTFNGSPDEDVVFADFEKRNISTNPGHGDLLSSTNNNRPVVVSHGSHEDYTNNLTVQNNAATLEAFAVTGYAIFPPFSPDITDYSLTVPGNVSSVVLTAAVTRGSGAAITAGGEYQNISLSGGSGAGQVTVTAEDGITKKTYTLAVNRYSSVNVIVEFSAPDTAINLDDLSAAPISWTDNTAINLSVSNTYNYYEWYIDGHKVVEGATAFIFNRTARQFSVGQHTISVKVRTAGGTIYSKDVKFTVEAGM